MKHAELLAKTKDLTVSVNGQIASIRCQLEKYIVDNDIKSLVIGVSGGIDSAVCCALAKPVCDHLKIPLLGYGLWMNNTFEEVQRAEAIGSHLCTSYTPSAVLAYSHKLLTQHLVSYRYHTLEDKIRAGNIKARLRMIYLYDQAQKHHGMVLSTDNLTEYLLGFWTLHGDVGDYGMIQDLWKGEVYGLAYELAKQADCIGKWQNRIGAEALADCIEATPTDGLGITDSDLDQLGASSYDEVDIVLKEWLSLTAAVFGADPREMVKQPGIYKQEARDTVAKLKDHPVIKRHLATEFKRNNPTNISRDTFKERE